jgi:hypothetical protein
LAVIAAKYSVSACGKPSYQPVVIVAGMSACSCQKRVKSFSFFAHHSSYAPRVQ